MSGVIGGVCPCWGGTRLHTCLLGLEFSASDDVVPPVWGWCLLNPLSISLSAWIHFHRNLRFPQSSSSSSSRRSWICLYNSVSLWISDAGLVPIIFSTVLRLVTLRCSDAHEHIHPQLCLPFSTRSHLMSSCITTVVFFFLFYIL